MELARIGQNNAMFDIFLFCVVSVIQFRCCDVEVSLGGVRQMND